jgi:extracellular matrix regulatory protein B
MFIHIGGDTMVRLRDVIGIFDYHEKSGSDNALFLENAKRNDAVEVVELGEIKSFIVTDHKVYYSPISSLTLKKRAHFIDLNAKESEEKV